MATHDDILVIGLGRFGQALAQTLISLGHEVMAIDSDPAACQASSQSIGHVVHADGTSADALRQVGAGEFRTAVVAIGNDIQASIMATYALVDLGIPRIWAKAITGSHGAILQRVGAHRVVFPERDMGVRVAHTMMGQTIDYVELDDEFVLIETTIPKQLAGKQIGEAQVRSKFEVTVLCVKRPGGKFTYATQETTLNIGDVVVIFGATRKAEQFAALD